MLSYHRQKFIIAWCRSILNINMSRLESTSNWLSYFMNWSYFIAFAIIFGICVNLIIFYKDLKRIGKSTLGYWDLILAQDLHITSIHIIWFVFILTQCLWKIKRNWLTFLAKKFNFLISGWSIFLKNQN